MPHASAADGVKLYYEETGSGIPVIFVHEFAGDHRSFESQVRHLSRQYRCITFNARGYPPSEVPPDFDSYSQDKARDDILAVLDGLKIDKAHVVGISMGGFAALHFGMQYPQRALSISVCGCGYGAQPEKRAQFQAEVQATAQNMQEKGMKVVAETYAISATRVQLQNKDPRGFAEFKRQLAEHDDLGSANTMRGCQARRPSLYELTDRMARISVPTLIAVGDEDEPCLEPALFMKRTIPTASLVMFPGTGHALNLEEPDLFNATLERYFHLVESGRWQPRDPRSKATSILGDGKK
jgi:pimeloyl-ACP methyl ester carboxylesterase